MPLSLRMSRDVFPHVKTQIAVLVETNVSVYSGTATMYLFVFKSYPPNHYHNHLVQRACPIKDLLSGPGSFSAEKSGRYRRDKIGKTQSLGEPIEAQDSLHLACSRNKRYNIKRTILPANIFNDYSTTARWI